jgi:hypothetical protein
MSGTAAGLILGFLASTLYGAGFHLVFGGPLRRIPIFLVAAWVGFAVGHFAGDLLGLDLLKLGAINLLSGSIGAWLALLGSLWLSGGHTLS